MKKTILALSFLVAFSFPFAHAYRVITIAAQNPSPQAIPADLQAVTPQASTSKPRRNAPPCVVCKTRLETCGHGCMDNPNTLQADSPPCLRTCTQVIDSCYQTCRPSKTSLEKDNNGLQDKL